MLIKLYTLENDIHIIEGVQDVTVYNTAPESPRECELFVFDDIGKVVGNPAFPSRIIEYAKDGICQLLVFNKAYICNDDGKTLEKVVSVG